MIINKRILSLMVSFSLAILSIASNVKAFNGNIPSFLMFVFPYLLSNLVISVLAVKAMFNKPQEVNDTWGTFFISVTATSLPLLVSLFNKVISPNVNTTFVMIGLIIHLTVVPFYLAGVVELGKSYSVLPEACKLKTTGIYSISRHPLYTTYIIWYISQNFICQTWIIAVISIIQITLQILRAKKEEKILEKNFPEYADYKKKVWWIGRKPILPSNMTE